MLTLAVPWWEIVVRPLADLSAAILEAVGSISIIEKRGERVRRTPRRARRFKQ